MKNKVLEILLNTRPDVEFDSETKLIDDGVLDSFDIIGIVSDLNEEFDINITADELEADNFNSLEAIVKLVEGMMNL